MHYSLPKSSLIKLIKTTVNKEYGGNYKICLGNLHNRRFSVINY